MLEYLEWSAAVPLRLGLIYLYESCLFIYYLPAYISDVSAVLNFALLSNYS